MTDTKSLSLRDQVIALRDEMNAALNSGAFFNPELFGAMLRRGDNPVLRWRDQLDTLLSGIRGGAAQNEEEATRVDPMGDGHDSPTAASHDAVRPALSASRIGVSVTCATCGQRKKPVGRSAPMGLTFCDDDCPGYWQYPKPGSLWPGESESEFGYPVSVEGTTDARPIPSPAPALPTDVQAAMRAALQRIVDWSDCGCEHDSDDCCALHADADFHCPGCIAAKALRASVVSQEQR